LPDTLRDYELAVILSPEIGDDAVTESIDRLGRLVTTRGGEIVDTNHWGRRRLAYPIRTHLEGNYVISQIKLEPGKVAELESSLRIAEEILRHMIIQAGEKDEAE